MWFIGVKVEQETSAPPPKKKILDPPLHILVRLLSANKLVAYVIAYVASVSV